MTHHSQVFGDRKMRKWLPNPSEFSPVFLLLPSHGHCFDFTGGFSLTDCATLAWMPVHQTTPQMGKRKSKYLAAPSPGYPTRVPAASYSRFSTVHTWDIQNSPLNSFFIGFAHNVFPVLMLSFQSSSRLTLGKLEALFACHTMCDLSSRIRDPTHTLCNESLNHWTIRKSRR